MQLSDMTPIETTYEAICGDYVYRVSAAATYTIIKRSKESLWHHGILTEAYDRDEHRFLPMVRVNNARLTPAVAEGVLAALGSSERRTNEARMARSE